MTQHTSPAPRSRRKIYRTLASLFRRIGPIPPARLRLWQAPGMAEECHVTEIEAKEERLCELVDGVLIEKDMSTFESLVSALIGHFLLTYLETHDLGMVLGGAATLRLGPGLLRIPDLSFISWEQLPDGRLPEDPIANLYPDLAVEVISAGNTPGEMRRKLRDYFAAGTQLVWFIYPKLLTAEVYADLRKRKKISKSESLEGGSLLPGFELSMEKLYARVPKQG